MKSFLVFASVLALSPVLLSLPAAAAPDAAPKTEKAQKAKETEKDAKPATVKTVKPVMTTPMKKWIDAENALVDPLTKKQKESVFVMRNKYSVIRVIEIVKRDIGNAVQSCSKENPGMKGKMNTRFDQWKGNVDPILKSAAELLQKDIDAQKNVDAGAFRNVLKLNDEAYEDGEKHVVKKVVTSADACERLVGSMDRTENEMVTLLEQTLLPESVIIQRSEKMNREDAKKKKTEKPAATKAAEEPKKKAD